MTLPKAAGSGPGRCEGGSCGCPVSGPSRYCSAYCENADRDDPADDEGAACACGHAACARAQSGMRGTEADDEVKLSIGSLLDR